MNWAGPYAGINFGAAWNHSSFTDVDYFFFLLPSGPGNNFWSNTQAEATVGGLFGYNWQSGKIVYGIEGDLNWVNGKSSATIPSIVPVVASSNLHWMGTVRGRLGVTYDPSTLYYITGGIAVARYSDSWGDPVLGGAFIFSSDYTRTGWTIGGGVEHMFAPHWIGRIEALFTDFGTQTSSVFASGTNYRTQFEHTVTQVRGAFSYKW
jgi:outer membrane immunogenic protein